MKDKFGPPPSFDKSLQTVMVLHHGQGLVVVFVLAGDRTDQREAKNVLLRVGG